MGKLMKRIGIDLDKTIFTLKSLAYDILNKIQFLKNKDKIKYNEIKITEVKDVNSVIKKIHKVFNPKHYKPFPDAIETINKFHDAGYEIYFISNRPNVPAIVKATVAWIKENNIHCDKLILGCNNKGEYASQNGIDIMIDDMLENCTSLIKHGVKAIQFNKNQEEYENDIVMLNSWKKIGQYVENYFEDETLNEIEEIMDR